MGRPGVATLCLHPFNPQGTPRYFFTRMASINIRRDVQDTFYRYKMPKITVKVTNLLQSCLTVC